MWELNHWHIHVKSVKMELSPLDWSPRTLPSSTMWKHAQTHFFHLYDLTEFKIPICTMWKAYMWWCWVLVTEHVWLEKDMLLLDVFMPLITQSFISSNMFWRSHCVCIRGCCISTQTCDMLAMKKPTMFRNIILGVSLWRGYMCIC